MLRNGILSASTNFIPFCQVHGGSDSFCQRNRGVHSEGHFCSLTSRKVYPERLEKVLSAKNIQINSMQHRSYLASLPPLTQIRISVSSLMKAKLGYMPLGADDSC